MVRANNSAIAVVGKLTDKNMLKVLGVSNSDGGKTGNYAFKPDINSIFNGDYPMVLPFYVVCQKDKIAKAKPLNENTIRRRACRKNRCLRFL